MNSMEILETKVRLAVERITALRQENKKLEAEVKFLRDENTRAKQLVRENDLLQEEKKAVSTRIEKLLKKINSLSL
jgi:FtsZ-binding cell division protein ZapB